MDLIRRPVAVIAAAAPPAALAASGSNRVSAPGAGHGIKQSTNGDYRYTTKNLIFPQYIFSC